MMSAQTTQVYKYKHFTLNQDRCIMKSSEAGLLLGVWSESIDPQFALDIGSGAGVVSLILAQRYSDAIVDAVEVDQGSYDDCVLNFEASPWSDRLRCVLTPVQEYAKASTRRYDLVVCNPPFFSGGTHTYSTDKETSRNATKLSHSDLLRSTKALLTATGKFCIILPLIEGLRFSELAATSGLHLIRRTDISQDENSSVDRLLLTYALKSEEHVEQSKITLYTSTGNQTESFQALTADILQ